MPKSKEFVSSSESDSDTEGKPKAKKSKKESKPAPAAAGDKAKVKTVRSGSDELIELGTNKYLSVSEFRGKQYVNIREYYTDDKGDLKPTKKGVALGIAQWEKLKSLVDEVDSRL